MRQELTVLHGRFEPATYWPARRPAAKRWAVFMRTSFGDYEYGRYATEKQALGMAQRINSKLRARLYVAAPDGAKYTPLP